MVIASLFQTNNIIIGAMQCEQKKFVLGATIVTMLLITSACTGNTVPVDALDEGVGSYDQLVTALQANSVKVETAGIVSQPFFEPEGKVIRLDDQEVQVFKFANEGDTASAAETIFPDGSSIGTSLASWIAPPHFYHA